MGGRLPAKQSLVATTVAKKRCWVTVTVISGHSCWPTCTALGIHPLSCIRHRTSSHSGDLIPLSPSETSRGRTGRGFLCSLCTTHHPTSRLSSRSEDAHTPKESGAPQLSRSATTLSSLRTQRATMSISNFCNASASRLISSRAAGDLARPALMAKTAPVLSVATVTQSTNA